MATTRFGREFLVNTTTTSGQWEPAAIALADGRFVISWTDASMSAGDTSGKAVRAQIFNADGSKAGAEFVVNTTTTGFQSVPTITAFADGRFVISWTDESASAGDSSGSAIRAQIFNLDGSKAGAEFLVNTATANDQNQPTIKTLSDGRFVVSWVDSSASVGDTNGTAIRAQIFNADGSKAGAEFLVNTTTGNSQFQPTIAALAEGRFVISWRDFSGNTSDSVVRAQMFNANGSKAGAEFRLDGQATSLQAEPCATTLADGRFVICWTGGKDGSGLSIQAQIFNADGSKSGAEFTVNSTTAGSQMESTITALADGRFVISWTDDSYLSGDGFGSGIKVQVFNADGTKAGGEIWVNTTTAEDQVEPTITALADGRFVVSWMDYSATGGDTSIYAVRAQIFDPREAAVNLAGSTLNDQFVGTGFADTMTGAAGNDLLQGRLGADTIKGEAGADRLLGGGGDDQLTGGGAADRLAGDGGKDVLSGGAGEDRLIGGAGADRLTGGAGADRFVFATSAQAKGDRITDFATGDKIDLSAFMDGGKFIGAAAFKPAGTQAEVRYDKAKGLLQGDVDGNGTVDWTLTLANKAALVAGDFLF